MLNEKDVSKELTDAVSKVLSRRDAVKKAGSIAAGAALAFLGLGLPGISQQKAAIACCSGCGDCCERNCSENCGDDAMSGCSGCDGICSTSCEGACVGGCAASCIGYTQ